MQAFEDYKKVREVIKSCNNEDQLRVGVKMYNLLDRKHGKVIPPQYFEVLENIIGLMRLKCGIEGDKINEEEDTMKDQFRNAAAMVGPPLNQIAFVDESDSKDIDENILKEINIGTQIEKNHCGDDEATQLATQNVKEVSDYYTNPDYAILAIENEGGKTKKTIRISKKEMDQLHNTGKIEKKDHTIKYKIKEDLEMDDIPHSLSKQLNKTPSRKYSREDIDKEIRKRREIELERRRKEETDDDELWGRLEGDEIEEQTSAASSGAYVGPMTQDVITRVIKKDIPVSVNGVVGKHKMNTPIGKLYSMGGVKSESEVLEEEDIEEATSYADAVGAYDTPGFAPSEFMGTAGKKGKAPVNKGITHQKLAYPGGRFVKIKNRCARFPYCNQSPEAIKISKKPFKDAFYENKKVKKRNLSIKK